MRLGPDITRIAAMLGDPARANMLASLMCGQALTAGELAHEAGITPQTASAHLSKLELAGLLIRRRQGRHSYVALAGGEVAEILEQLAVMAARAGHMRTRPGPRDPDLRRARVCYDHLAGSAGVAMLDGLLAAGLIEDRTGSLVLTEAGRGFVTDFGVELVGSGRRPLCKACLDWSVRRNHLGGELGAGLLSRIYSLGWARRVEGSRLVTFSAPGRRAFEARFGPLEVP
jgi:DNA-binding transcriptional ArsR family regulator